MSNILWISGHSWEHDRLSPSYTLGINSPRRCQFLSFLWRGWDFRPTYSFHSRIWSDLGLYWSYACCHYRYELICVAALLCPEDTVSIFSVSYILSAFFSAWYLDIQRKYGIYALFRAENSAAFFCPPWPLVGLCANHCLLQIEAVMVRFEKGNNFWI